MSETDQLQAQNEQREQAREKLQAQFASFDDMLAKEPVVDEFGLTINGKELRFRFVAISAIELDDLMLKAPPSTKQKANGQAYDPARFAELLLSAVCQIPQLSADQWGQLFRNGKWSSGEAGWLFARGYELCQKGCDPTPTPAG